MSAERAKDCYLALELSQHTWLIGYLLPGADKVQTTAVAGGNAETLLSALGKIESLAVTRSHAGCVLGSMRVCFEAVMMASGLPVFLSIAKSILQSSTHPAFWFRDEADARR